MDITYTTRRSFFDIDPEITLVEVVNFNSKGMMLPQGTWEDRSLIYKFHVSVKAEGRIFDWTVSCRYQEVKEMHDELTRQIHHQKLPKFPKAKKMQPLPPNERLKLLETYLQELTGIDRVNEHYVFWEFLEISLLSFDGITKKRKEGYIYKRTGGRIANENKFCNCGKYFRRYQRRWFIVRDNLVGYLTDNRSENLNEALMFKGKFKVDFGSQAAGYEDGIKLSTSTREFIFRTGSIAKRNEWVDAIKNAYDESEWNAPANPHESSFPVREQNSVTAYVDAAGYFEAVHDALLRARRQVLICDWWLSPEVYLKRPSTLYPDSMLKKVLQKVASNGVEVYIHLYKEVELALTLNSQHSKDSLEAMHQKIKVIRHPHRSIVGGEFLWSHHDKMVVIDNELAFLGGLDLCFGRMDDNQHLLVDNGPIQTWNGIDYSNVRIADFTDVSKWERDSIDRNTFPRMPWHDVALSARGKIAADVALHFIELWNHVMTDITSNYYKSKKALEPMTARNIEEFKRSFARIEEPIHEMQAQDLTEALLEETKEPVRIRGGSYDRRSSSGTSKGSFSHRKSHGNYSHLGDDLERVLVEDHAIPIHSSRLNPNIVRIMTQQATGPLAESKHVMRSATRVGEEENRVEINQLLRPQPLLGTQARRVAEPSLRSNPETEELIEKHRLTEEIKRDEEHYAKNLLKPVLKQKTTTVGTCTCQVLRSAATWSFGLDSVEKSIHNAYLSLIAKAEHFIYIENQFFISSTAGDPVKNNIAKALVERIKTASQNGESFKVIVVMPLLPAFEGSINDPNAAVLRLQLFWEYQSISRGFRSLYTQLREEANIENPNEYISFYGLRTHASLGGVPVTEIVYVHSKLMIVDDNFVIIGSANINDRSMLGHNDSEVALLVEDTTKVQVTMDGSLYEVSKFAHDLRMAIFSEHSGCSDPAALVDPFSHQFEEAWNVVAKNNTMRYRHVFACYPDDEIGLLQEIAEYQQRAIITDYPYLRDSVKGFLVDFPLEFLRREDLRISIFNKEFYIPEVSFV